MYLILLGNAFGLARKWHFGILDQGSLQKGHSILGVGPIDPLSNRQFGIKSYNQKVIDIAAMRFDAFDFVFDFRFKL
jgi:hypothetical protein